MNWYFAIYEGIEIREIYLMEREALEPFFAACEEKWHARGGRDLNNPKIPVKFVRGNGRLVFETEPY